MYKELGKKVASGVTFAGMEMELRPEGFVPSMLADCHILASGHTTERPGYIKEWRKSPGSRSRRK